MRAIVTGLVLIPSLALAGPTPGDVHLGAGIGAIQYTALDVEDADVEALQLGLGASGQVRGGYVVSESFELGLALAVGQTDTEVEIGNRTTDGESTRFVIGPYLAFHIPVGSDGSTVLSPIATVQFASTDDGPAELDILELGGGALFHVFVADDASIDLGAFFLYGTGEASVDGLPEADVDGFSVGGLIGISIWP